MFQQFCNCYKDKSFQSPYGEEGNLSNSNDVLYYINDDMIAIRTFKRDMNFFCHCFLFVVSC